MTELKLWVILREKNPRSEAWTTNNSDIKYPVSKPAASQQWLKIVQEIWALIHKQQRQIPYCLLHGEGTFSTAAYHKQDICLQV